MLRGYQTVVQMVSTMLIRNAMVSMLLISALITGVLAAKDAPQWPEQYELSFTMSIPYVKKLQKDGLVYSYQYWRDAHQGRQKMIRDDKETQYIFLKEDMKYDIVPANDRLKCFKTNIGGGSGPTEASATPAAPSAATTQRRMLHVAPKELAKLGFLLPDLSEERWQRNGTVVEGGTRLDRYTYLLREDMGYGQVAGQYDFLVDGSGAPKELRMWGINLYTGGHFDDYRVRYTHYSSGSIPDDVFDFDPSNCTKLEQDLPGSGAAMAARILPSVHHGDHEYDVFMHHSGRRHASSDAYLARKAVYYKNKAIVEVCNAANRSYTCAINQFGDWTSQERRSLMRQPVRADDTKQYKHMKPHVPAVPLHFLPSTVDWRGTPGDSPVKDQAACGSCWAFSSVQALEGAYFRATGKALLLSEQHLLNCAWNVPQNHGCFGGDQDMALEWVFDQGVIATEAALPYEGVFDYCPATLKGYETMEALLTKGPLTVSIDASADDMSFYKSGVYANPACATEESELDHAVMLSGYGEQDGVPYWIVKNTWSTYWGEEGYLRVSRRPDDCGISSQVMYAEMEVLEVVDE